MAELVINLTNAGEVSAAPAQYESAPAQYPLIRSVPAGFVNKGYGVNFRSVQLLLGHESLETTMIYTHLARKGVIGVASPLDLLIEISDEDLRAAVLATEQVPIHCSCQFCTAGIPKIDRFR